MDVGMVSFSLLGKLLPPGRRNIACFGYEKIISIDNFHLITISRIIMFQSHDRLPVQLIPVPTSTVDLAIANKSIKFILSPL